MAYAVYSLVKQKKSHIAVEIYDIYINYICTKIKLYLYANNNKIHKNWHNIISKVQLAGDSQGCRMHATTTTLMAATIAEGIAIAGPRNSAMQ